MGEITPCLTKQINNKNETAKQDNLYISSSSREDIVLFLFFRSPRLLFCFGGVSVRKLIILFQFMYEFLY